VAREAHADLFLSGALLKVGTRLRLDLRVQDTNSGRVVFADKVEGDNAQAVFAMADKATAGLLAQIAPSESGTQLNVGASLTSNLDALHEYEEGVAYQNRFLIDDAQAAYRRAIQLDPNFAMAHYQLADLCYDNFQAGRQAILPAAALAQHSPLPPLERLLIQSIQLRYDGRLPEAEEMLRRTIREFPSEIGPRFALMSVIWDQGREGEAKPTLEEIVRIDPQRPLVYNYLAYEEAALGNVNQAVADVDKYASMLPPNDPNPRDSRGDVLRMGGRFQDAIAEYQTIVDEAVKHPGIAYGVNFEKGKIALTYLSMGNLAKAESTARDGYVASKGLEHASLAGILGEVDVGHGQFDAASGYFDEAARAYADQGYDTAKGPLFEAAQIHLEQGRPDMILALGRRDTTPWAPAVRALGELALHDEQAANSEFANLRNSLSAPVGDYAAEKTATTIRILAAEFDGQWQQVRMLWPKLVNRDDKTLAGLAEGRAELESGDLAEAQRQLTTLQVRGRIFGNERYVAYSDFLSEILSTFYLAEIYEKTGRKSEATKGYQDFLHYVGNSNARLPQIAEARTALKRL
jgi:eukaryotic-like serine/threonine-protein kinase